MKKLKNILWLMACILVLAACSDSTSDDDVIKETEPTKPTVEKKIIKFKDDYVRVASNANKLEFTMNLTSNASPDSIDFMILSNSAIFPSKNEESGSASTRALSKWKSYYWNVEVNANTGAHSRVERIIAVYRNDHTICDTLEVIQDGTALKESTDFSKDSLVTVLQTHTEGTGIPIVLMGDAFGDTEVNDGTYEKSMRKAMDNLFSEQPMTALRDYFDVYMVTVVSKQNDVGRCYDTSLSTIMPSDGTTEINGDDGAVQNYAGKVADKFNLSQKQYNNFQIIVILNNNNYAGTTYFYSDKKGNPLNFSIAYCPVIGSLDNENFKRVLVHEAVGHGFAKLADEYSYDTNPTVTADIKNEIINAQHEGWFKNVSVSSTDLPWADFAKDTIYNRKPELIGAFEGGYTYQKGVWRPSDESLMNSNTNHFNAPSRKLIYDKVLEHNGKSASLYTAYKEFDQKHYPDFSTDNSSTALSRAASPWARKPFGRPKFKTLYK